MQTAAKPLRRARLRASNRTKCLFCYLICFSVPLLYQVAALWFVYPFWLAGTAPGIADNLSAAFPWLSGLLSELAASADIGAAHTPDALSAALEARDMQWRLFLCGVAAAAWLITLIAQLAWRAVHAKPYMAARAFRSAVRGYRFSMLIILLVNALFAAGVWFIGARFIAGRTIWDYLTYFPVYALNIVAAFICFRLAAPPVLSGKGAFFKRL